MWISHTENNNAGSIDFKTISILLPYSAADSNNISNIDLGNPTPMYAGPLSHLISSNFKLETNLETSSGKLSTKKQSLSKPISLFSHSFIYSFNTNGTIITVPYSTVDTNRIIINVMRNATSKRFIYLFMHYTVCRKIVTERNVCS